MRYLIILGLLSFLFMPNSCYSQKRPVKGDVEYVSMENDVLTFHCKGTGINKKEALHAAEMNAFKILFFRGVPGSSNSAPMISVNEGTELQKHKMYFDKLFGGVFSTFVTASSVVSVYDKKNKSLGLEISINVRSLKQDLVSNKILSDYGF